MTVLELIERLKGLDPEATVYLADWNEAYAAPHPVGLVEQIGEKVVLDA